MESLAFRWEGISNDVHTPRAEMVKDLVLANQIGALDFVVDTPVEFCRSRRAGSILHTAAELSTSKT